MKGYKISSFGGLFFLIRKKIAIVFFFSENILFSARHFEIKLRRKDAWDW